MEKKKDGMITNKYGCTDIFNETDNWITSLSS